MALENSKKIARGIHRFYTAAIGLDELHKLLTREFAHYRFYSERADFNGIVSERVSEKEALSKE